METPVAFPTSGPQLYPNQLIVSKQPSPCCLLLLPLSKTQHDKHEKAKDSLIRVSFDIFLPNMYF